MFIGYENMVLFFLMGFEDDTVDIQYSIEQTITHFLV